MEQIPQIYIDEKEVAKIRNCGLSTLRNERHEGRGIAYIKDSRRVKYFLPDVYEYMESRKITPGDERNGVGTPRTDQTI